VRVRTVERFIGQMCDAGKDVSYNLFMGVDHFQTRQYSFVRTLDWMKAVLDGSPPESICGGVGG